MPASPTPAARPPLRALGAWVALGLVLLLSLGQPAESAPAARTTQVELRSFDGTRLEATLFDSGREAPLIIAGHGAAKSRLKDLSKARTTPEHIIEELVALGFHVLTYDRRGFGGSGGLGQLGELETDGADLQAVLDWVRTPGNVPGLLHDADGDAVLGYSGYSMSADPVVLMTTDGDFGALYMGIGLTDVMQAFTPGGKPYQGWLSALLLMSSRQEFSYRPELRRLVRQGLRHRVVSGMKGAEAFAAERSLDCGRVPWGEAPVMLMPGMSDGLYPLNHAARTWECLEELQGRDVRIIAQDRGHIIPGRFPKRGKLFDAFWPVENGFSIEDLQPRIAETVRCPEPIATAPMVARWFAHHLDPALLDEAQEAELAALPRVCLPVAQGEGVVLDALPEAKARFVLPETEVRVSNYDALPDALSRGDGREGLDEPVFIPLHQVKEDELIAGIPRLSLRVEELSARERRLSKLAVFIGVGVKRPGQPPELLNEQRQPFLINNGPFVDLELRGVAARLSPGEELGLLVYGHDFFFDAGALITKGGPDRARIRIAGEVSLPLLAAEPLLVETEAEAPAAPPSP
ncbi:MAG: hypothetical protein H6740_13845 [Alphaproteobacteria bacterium]|nr:hypothetical protein [Alphaproteobacteria bacterium]